MSWLRQPIALERWWVILVCASLGVNFLAAVIGWFS